MGGIVKSVGKVFGSLLGSSKPKMDPQQQTGFADYNASTHGANVTQLQRNPGLLGGPGVEAKLAHWDVLSKDYDYVNAQSKKGKAENRPQYVKVPSTGQYMKVKNIKHMRNELAALEGDLMKSIYKAPEGYGAQAPAPVAAPAPAAAAAPKPAAAPAPASTPAAAAAAPAAPQAAGPENIVGTSSAGTLGADVSGGGRKRSGRRGRVTTLLSGLGGAGSETFGG